MLPWRDAESGVEAYVQKCMLKVTKTKYGHIPLVAVVLAELRDYYPSLVSGVIDAVLEEIYRGLEVNELRDIQRRVGFARLLAELYNYRLVDSNLVFDTTCWVACKQLTVNGPRAYTLVDTWSNHGHRQPRR